MAAAANRSGPRFRPALSPRRLDHDALRDHRCRDRLCRQGRRRSQRVHPLAAPGAPVLERREHLRRNDVPQPADHAVDAAAVHAPAAGPRGGLLVRHEGRADCGLGLALLPDGPSPGHSATPVLRSGRCPASELPSDPERPASRQQQPGHPVPGRRVALRLAQGLRRARGAVPGAGDLLQGDAGAVPALLRLQAVVADRRCDVPGDGGVSPDRAQPVHRSRSSTANAWRCGGNG